jgi:peroxiredoxin
VPFSCVPKQIDVDVLPPSGTRALTGCFGTGAFTPTCSKTHLPGYIKDYDNLKSAGADVIVCIAYAPFCSQTRG